MTFAVGSLVNARGREWIVLPESKEDLLILRPLGGADYETTGIYLPLEKVTPAQFAPPSADTPGDHRSCKLLRDAVRLGVRASAGPFRSFGSLAVTPRPYQLVPLLMALKLDPVRLLIADDVGIGKTVEAALIAKELLDRGEIRRFAVLCPPHLAEQWQEELKAKFHIDATLVLSSTARRLERDAGLGANQSLFDFHDVVIVSTDFIKSTNKRDEFLRSCPEFVIVDEAHTCAFGNAGRGGRHFRYDLVKGLAANPDRHMIFVTATPHSGNEEAFRSLLTLLRPEFDSLPPDLGGDKNRRYREQVAEHFVQRRRADIKAYLDSATTFPDREELEKGYSLTPEWKELFDDVLTLARGVAKGGGGRSAQPIHWWSALGLLRALASSPLAARATLLSRADVSTELTPAQMEEYQRRLVLDHLDDSEPLDANPSADLASLSKEEKAERAKLMRLATRAEALAGKKDPKLQTIIPIVKGLIEDGFNPIIFCRFIATAQYLQEKLREALKNKIDVLCITGNLSPEERESTLLEFQNKENASGILVCTDCLSEGVNLQECFDAVIHYDLAWNPTRHEQREGRVDRYGQKTSSVRVVTYYGVDNQIDGIVLDTLIRKHKSIRNSIGISVPVPFDSEQVIESIFEGLLLREDGGSAQQFLPQFEEMLKKQRKDLHAEWEKITEKESKSRTLFAQSGIKPDVVAHELKAVKDALGPEEALKDFAIAATTGLGGVVNQSSPKDAATFTFQLKEFPDALKTQPGFEEEFTGSFKFPSAQHAEHLSRTSPFICGLASYLVETALDGGGTALVHRAGCIRTKSVTSRTVVLLTRMRFQIIEKTKKSTRELLAEDCRAFAFTGEPDAPKWLAPEAVEELLAAEPAANITTDQSREQVKRILTGFNPLLGALEKRAREVASELGDAHTRVRVARKDRAGTIEVEPKLPVDILGIYIFLPVPK